MTDNAARLRVGFLGTADPENPRSWSGTYANMLRALRKRGLEVSVLPWRAAPPDRVSTLLCRIRPTGKPGHDWVTSRDHARAVESALRARPVDVILAVAASTQSARLTVSVPVVSATDTTFRAVVDRYPAFSGLGPQARRQGERIDRASVRRAARLIYPSAWAAQAAVSDCAAAPERIAVVPYGANLTPPYPLRRRALPAEPTILFVGVDWERKGGAVVVSAVDRLRAAGHRLRLVCVGARVPEHLRASVNEECRFDKATEEGEGGLVDLYTRSDVLFLPSRADCSPIVLCEAAAMGVPSLASDVGGIPEIVRDGVTGRVLPVDADVDTWAQALDEILDPHRHARMSAAAREEYETSLNWDHWGEEVERVLRDAVALGSRRPRSAT